MKQESHLQLDLYYHTYNMGKNVLMKGVWKFLGEDCHRVYLVRAD